MIIVQLVGGLGNQMFQYALGRRLSLERGVPLYLDVSWFQNIPANLTHRVYELGIYNIVAQIAPQRIVDQATAVYSHRSVKGLLHRIRRKLGLHTLVVSERQPGVFQPEVLRAPRNSYLRGYWQSEKYIKPIREYLRSEFTPKLPVRQLYRELTNQVLERNSVSVHIRRSDYVHNPIHAAFHGVLPVEYYIDAIREILMRVNDPTFFIFTDDMAWSLLAIQEIASQFSKPLTFYLLANNWEQVHGLEYASAPIIIIEDPSASVQREVWQNRLWVMRHCKHHIIANSSFSWWAAWLSENPDKVVIAPKRWFAQIEAPDTVPADWLRL
jgi:hypothetical protein